MRLCNSILEEVYKNIEIDQVIVYVVRIEVRVGVYRAI
jgi:hypothetical protein